MESNQSGPKFEGFSNELRNLLQERYAVNLKLLFQVAPQIGGVISLKVKDPIFGAPSASTSKSEVKAYVITNNYPFYHAMNMIMSRFNKLKGKRVDYPIITLPHDTFTSGSALIIWDAVQLS